MQNVTELNNKDSLVVAEEAVKHLLEKKALGVRLFDVREYTSVTEYYVNVTGRSGAHVAALSEELADNFSERGLSPLRIEGRQGNSWILVDYGFLIVNVFDAQSREFYNFDRLLPAECELGTKHLIDAVDRKLGID
jgi:ribosome-associated protein